MSHKIQKTRYAVLAVAAALVSFIAMPADALDPPKIAVVRYAEILQTAPISKSADQKLRGEADKLQADFQTKEKQLADDAQKFQRDRATMSPDAAERTERDLQTRQLDLQRAERKAKEDFDEKQGQESGQVQQIVNETIASVAKDKGFDLVLPQALTINKAYDITDDVMAKLSQGTSTGKSGK